MADKIKKQRLLIAIGLVGMAVSVLALLEPRIPGLTQLCLLLEGGCRDTSEFTLLGVPISILGLAYYSILLLCLLFFPSLVFRLIMAGAGVEATLLYVLVTQQIYCPFCFMNILVVGALVILVLQRARGWEAMAIGLLVMVLSYALFTYENIPHAAPARAPSDPSAVVARVGDTVVTAGELERSMAGRLHDSRMKIHHEKEEELDRLIASRLLELEAQRLNTGIEEVRAGALKDVPRVGPGEVSLYLDKNPAIRSSWEGSEEELRGRVKAFLEHRMEADAIRAFISDLRNRYPVEVLLAEPPLPMTHVALGGSPSMGPPDAPVTVVEFSDYRCPACLRAHEISVEIREKYRDRIRWVYKDFPLQQRSVEVAAAARCAQDQDLFWEYQDLLFMARGDKDLQGLLDLAEEAGLDVNLFEQCVKEGRHRENVLADRQAAREAGVNVTPTYIVNGRIKPGVPRPGELEALIESELEAALGN